MNIKILRIGLVIVGVALLLGIVTFFILRNRNAKQTFTDENGQINTFVGNLPQSGNADTQNEDGLVPNLQGVGIGDVNFGNQVVVQDLKRRSINFIERLGSYSSDSALTNFDDVLPQVSPEFEVILRAKQQEKLSEYKTNIQFIGYTVTAVTANANTENLDNGNGNVSVTVNAIREISGLSDEVIKDNKKYSINWILGEDGRWRVNGISGDY